MNNIERIDVDEHPLIILMGREGNTRIITDLPTATVRRMLNELVHALGPAADPRPPRARSLTGGRELPEWMHPDYEVVEEPGKVPPITPRRRIR